MKIQKKWWKKMFIGKSMGGTPSPAFRATKFLTSLTYQYPGFHFHHPF
jgi:hypothetical protein